MAATKGQLLFLGTGGSMGIPLVGCHCQVCSSSNLKNRRLRTSALLTWKEKQILIDAGPDFRQQALKYGIERLDALLLTHAHFDHVGGIDELRIYFFRHQKALPCFLSKWTYEEVRRRYAHLFEERGEEANVTAQIEFHLLEQERGKVQCEQMPLHYFTYQQGTARVTGFRVGDLAYVSDIKFYPDSIFEDLEGVSTLVVSALRKEKSHVHFTLEEAIAFAKQVKADHTYFVHMAHEVDHETINQQLPPKVELSYDGLTIDFHL